MSVLRRRGGLAGDDAADREVGDAESTQGEGENTHLVGWWSRVVIGSDYGS